VAAARCEPVNGGEAAGRNGSPASGPWAWPMSLNVTRSDPAGWPRSPLAFEGCRPSNASRPARAANAGARGSPAVPGAYVPASVMLSCAWEGSRGSESTFAVADCNQ
jgi:hypothetical protein